MRYQTWQEALAGMVREAALDPNSELARLSRAATSLSSDEPSESGYPDTDGIAGAPGPLMSASGWTDPRQVVVCTTPENGLNTFQGQIQDISLLWKGDVVVECTLMVSFDSPTGSRLLEKLSIKGGKFDMGDAEYSVTIVIEEAPTTSPSTSPRSRWDGTLDI